ncbi:MAG: chemotaxis protein CheV [Nitrospinae bacterium]|nr:chemotaxis protein CheV [Nitrospinota bacterium]
MVNKRAVRLREQIIPVLGLDKVLGLPEKEPAGRTDVYVLILTMGKEKLGAVVDTLISEEDIVLAPLPPHMQKNDLAAGATLVGRDEVVVLLHAPKLFALAKTAGEMDLAAKYRGEEKKTLRILAIDDSLSTREIEKSILESYGYSVDLASDRVEGLEKAMESKYDLVTTDVEMPRMDGFSLTEKLRGESGYKHTPIVIVTSRDREEDKRRGIQVGANAYIVKDSFDQSNLIETVQNLVE